MSKNIIYAGKNTSIWIDTTPETGYPALNQNVDTDVAIVGGGITGLMIAFFLQRAGFRVIILEESRIVKKTSGYTTAKITSAHGIIYKYLIDTFGYEKAKIYADANQQAVEEIDNLVKEFEIDCDFERLPAYTYALTEKDDKTIEEEVEAAKSLGLPVSFARETPLPYQISSAIKYENQAKFHPRKFLLEIASIIQKNGGQIFEETRVLNIEDGDGCKVITNIGTITAKKVVVATNRPIYDPIGLFLDMPSRQSFTIGIEVNGPLPTGVFYGPEDGNFHSLRTQPLDKDQEVLIIGGEVHHKDGNISNDSQYELLEEWAQKYFPVKSLKYRWTTSDSESYDRVPIIGKISAKTENIFVATGFTGWGMAHATVAGLILTDEIMGKSHPWSSLYSSKRFLEFKLDQSKIIINKKETNMTSYDENFSDLKVGDGAVREIDGKKVAADRDNDGNLHIVSAVCTHMGCIVGWNKKDQTWDCPCHGSRYDLEGKVIHGPAPRDLSKDI